MEADQAVQPVPQDVEQEHEPCPTPLAWQQVVEAYRNESDCWTMSREQVTFSGRTWGEGPPLYFLNGFYGSSELFALTAYLLREEYTCVLWDYPTVPRRSLAEYAGDLNFVAAELGHNDVAVFGTSFGAAVALEAMCQEPDRISRAILQAAVPFVKSSVFERMAMPLAGRWNVSLRRLPGWHIMEQVNHLPWFPPFDSSRWSFFAADGGATQLCDVVQRVRAVKQSDLRTNIAKIRQPVLLIRTEGEGALRSQAQQELAIGLSNCVTEEIPASGRIPFLTHPHRLVKLLRPFLERDVPLTELVADAQKP